MSPPSDRAVLQALTASLPLPSLAARLVWTAAVDIAPRRDLGRSGLGERFIVPILGGQFWGGPGFEAFGGRVLPGGADRQLLRADGVKELRAEYEMETDDGAVITVDNRVVIDDSVQPERYALSHLHVTAPEGPHAWLNRRVLVGTLQVLRPQREAVLIRSWLLDLQRS
ncbi:MAG: DUF3237 domain-containing protein [Rubrivivax sp.]